MLEISNFSKSYGLTNILEIPQLKISEGITWIQGKNGSGKSTLLKVIAGLLDFKGDVLIENRISLKKQPIAYRRIVNFAESEPLFPGNLNGWDMINLFLAAKQGSLELITNYMRGFEMIGYLDDPIKNYSAGMVKTLSLVLGFIGQPKLILLDEPFITLDSHAMLLLSRWIGDEHKKGVNFIITSHQAMPDAMILHNTYILEKRTLIQQTASHDL